MGRFRKGQSGNPAGKPKGARNHVTLAVEALLDGEAEAISRKCIELAKAGDMTAIRLCMERVYPARRDRPIAFPMPALATAGDALKASTAIVSAVAAGELTPGEAAELAKVIDGFTRAVEASDLAERITRLEQVLNR